MLHKICLCVDNFVIQFQILDNQRSIIKVQQRDLCPKHYLLQFMSLSTSLPFNCFNLLIPIHSLLCILNHWYKTTGAVTQKPWTMSHKHKIYRDSIHVTRQYSVKISDIWITIVTKITRISCLNATNRVRDPDPWSVHVIVWSLWFLVQSYFLIHNSIFHAKISQKNTVIAKMTLEMPKSNGTPARNAEEHNTKVSYSCLANFWPVLHVNSLHPDYNTGHQHKRYQNN